MTLPKRPRVLIAEDHPGVAKAICRLLALECDIVGNVADGRTVLDATQRLQPDVVVVDLNLPHVHAAHDRRGARRQRQQRGLGAQQRHARYSRGLSAQAFARNTLVTGNSTINVDPTFGITGYAPYGAKRSW